MSDFRETAIEIGDADPLLCKCGHSHIFTRSTAGGIRMLRLNQCEPGCRCKGYKADAASIKRIPA